MGFEGLLELGEVRAAGRHADHRRLDVDDHGRVRPHGGVTVEHPAELFARGSILRGVFADLKSPIAYGYDGKDLPVYFNQDPVLNAAAAAAGFGGGGGGGGGAARRRQGQNVTPNARADPHFAARAGGDAQRATPRLPRGGAVAAARGGGGGGARWRRRIRQGLPTDRARAWCCSSRPTRTTCCCRARWRRRGAREPRRGSRRAARQGPRRDVRDPAVLALADAGHLLLGFNAILNWDRSTSRPGHPAVAATGQQRQTSRRPCRTFLLACSAHRCAILLGK